MDARALVRTDSIDPDTQVYDLTAEVKNISPDVVACGGFSNIYLGEWERVEVNTLDAQRVLVKTQVAIKLLRAFTNQRVDSVRARKRLNREVNVWRRLKHPNIAEFCGISLHLGGRPALVMVWYENGAAPTYLDARPDVDRLGLVKGVAEGLTYLHTMQPPVVHGDLKGNNILINDEGRPVLSDFGLSKVIEELSAPDMNMTSSHGAGPVRWQAPELLQVDDDLGDNNEVPREPCTLSDVWSFACTAYELITGRIPYYHLKYDWLVINEVNRGKSPVRPDDVILQKSVGLLQLLSDCWTLDPEKRLTMVVVMYRLKDLHLE